MDPRRYKTWTNLVLIIAGLSFFLVQTLAQPASNANVPVRELAAKVGSPANFSCGSNSVPVILCLWERTQGSDKLTVTINSDLALNGGTSDPNYGYVGAGLETGTCGLLIKNVKDEDNAVWNCKLVTAKGMLYQGNVHVGILKKPSKPEFSPNVQQIQNLRDPEDQNVKVIVTCGSYGGQPSPQLKWFVGDEEITDGLEPYENTVYAGQNWIHQTLAGHKFTFKDNGKDLRCVLVHDALTDNDVREVSEKITVLYGPKADSDVGPKFVPNMGQDVTLTVNITGNPKPSVVWRVGDLTIHPAQNRDKYTAYQPVEISKGLYATGLLIRSVDEEDLTKVYKLETKNAFGSETFDLRISSSDPGTGNGLSAGGIIGLVLGIPALLILIAVIVVYTRARGLLCFKGNDGTASEKERMDGESGTGVLGAEEKPVTVTQSFSSRLSAIYENLVAKKKDKGGPTAEDDSGNKSDKESVPVEVKTPQTEKTPEDIVYAELDLINETGSGKPVVRCTDDKTEYAEIVGVVPMGTTLGDQSKDDKSPVGSVNGGSPKN